MTEEEPEQDIIKHFRKQRTQRKKQFQVTCEQILKFNQLVQVGDGNDLEKFGDQTLALESLKAVLPLRGKPNKTEHGGAASMF